MKIQMMPTIIMMEKNRPGWLFFEVWVLNLASYYVCGSSYTGQEWVKNQHGVGADWGFTKSNTAQTQKPLLYAHWSKDINQRIAY